MCRTLYIYIRLRHLFHVIVAINIGNHQRGGLTFIMRPCDDLFYVGDLILFVLYTTEAQTESMEHIRKYFHTLARSIEPQMSGN